MLTKTFVFLWLKKKFIFENKTWQNYGKRVLQLYTFIKIWRLLWIAHHENPMKMTNFLRTSQKYRTGRSTMPSRGVRRRGGGWILWALLHWTVNTAAPRHSHMPRRALPRWWSSWLMTQLSELQGVEARFNFFFTISFERRISKLSHTPGMVLRKTVLVTVSF